MKTTTGTRRTSEAAASRKERLESLLARLVAAMGLVTELSNDDEVGDLIPELDRNDVESASGPLDSAFRAICLAYYCEAA